jgi:hypothetical protein
MTELNRAHLIELLGRLGEGDDNAALAAAREVSRTVKDAQVSWDELLRPEDATVPGAASSPQARPAKEPAAQTSDGRLIERLLARTDLSDTLRSDLGDFKRQLADGKLHKDDAEYIRALAKRLGA